MNKIKVLSFWGCECNPFANPETAGDGGGYFQPAGGCLLQLPSGEEVVVELDDTSCGCFGTRRRWEITAPARGMRWLFSTGSMDDASIDSDEDVDAILNSVWGCLGAADELLAIAREAVNMAAYRI